MADYKTTTDGLKCCDQSVKMIQELMEILEKMLLLREMILQLFFFLLDCPYLKENYVLIATDLKTILNLT